MDSQSIVYVPHPKQLTYFEGSYLLKRSIRISLPENEQQALFPTAIRLKCLLEKELQLSAMIVLGKRGPAAEYITFEKAARLPEEGYNIDINQEGVHIQYSSGAGALYAVSTLKQLIIQCGKKLPYVHIEDASDFAARGIMLDISRNKVPKMETLYQVADMMADLKLNHLQLYIEGFSFAYPSFPDVWKGETPITGEEILCLDRYCQERYIELVPNQNCFGHMAPWLYRAEFNDLAERPKGGEMPWGWYEKPFTLNPIDPKSIAFIKHTHDDLLPYFSSPLFNAGCDETFDLGLGRSREICEQVGTGRLYLDFIWKVHDLVREKGKKMMMWGDIIRNHPELIPDLPKDIIAMEWGYSPNAPTADNCKKYKDAEVPFFVCPGTSSWNSITGFTDTMRSNLLTAAINGTTYGAIGYLITDWGDCGHWQPLPVSYAGFAYGAAVSWGLKENKSADIAAYLDLFIFRDKARKMGQFALDLGNYYLCQKDTLAGITCIMSTLYFSQLDDSSTENTTLPDAGREDYFTISEYVTQLSDTIYHCEMQCDDAALIEQEYRLAVTLILHGAKLGLFKFDTSMNAAEQQLRLEWMIDELNLIINEFQSIWLQRNRNGGLGENLNRLNVLKKQYIHRKQLLRESNPN